jgi:acetyltransferase-like isoleucine patch superfamily enzyme
MIEVVSQPTLDQTPLKADRKLPQNVLVGRGTFITSPKFDRYRSKNEIGVLIGQHCTMDSVHFSVGLKGRIEIGDHCVFTNAVLMAEELLEIGNYVMLGFNVTIADTDFHPIAPAQRLIDAEAWSPVNVGKPRPPIVCRPVVIEDDVWVGPNATILKGVTIGRGSFIEPGAMVTRSLPPGSRVLGNPAQIIGTVDVT